MFKHNYTVVAKIEASHDYRADKSCPEVRFEPLRPTLDMAKDAGWLIKQQPGKVWIFAKTETIGGNVILDLPLAAPVCLHFLLRVADKSLGATADLSGASQYYFSNLFPDGSTTNPVISQGAQISGLDACPLIYPNNFTIPLLPGVYQSCVLQKLQPDVTTPWKTLAVFPIGNTQEMLEIKNRPNGRYRLVCNKSAGVGSDTQDFYIGTEANAANPLALVDVYLTPELLADLSVPSVFSFVFPYKSKIWKYYFTCFPGIGDESGNAAPLVALHYDKPKSGSRLPNNVKFTQVKDDTLSETEKTTLTALETTGNAIEAYLFKSSQAIPFLEGDLPTIALKNTEKNKDLLKEVPAPASSSPDASAFIKFVNF